MDDFKSKIEYLVACKEPLTGNVELFRFVTDTTRQVFISEAMQMGYECVTSERVIDEH